MSHGTPGLRGPEHNPRTPSFTPSSRRGSVDSGNGTDPQRDTVGGPTAPDFTPGYKREPRPMDILNDALFAVKDPKNTLLSDLKKMSRKEAEKFRIDLGPQLDRLGKIHTKIVNDLDDMEKLPRDAIVSEEIGKYQERIRKVEQKMAVGDAASKEAEKRAMSKFERCMGSSAMQGIMGLVNVLMMPLMIWPMISGWFQKSNNANQPQGYQ